MFRLAVQRCKILTSRIRLQQIAHMSEEFQGKDCFKPGCEAFPGCAGRTTDCGDKKKPFVRNECLSCPKKPTFPGCPNLVKCPRRAVSNFPKTKHKKK